MVRQVVIEPMRAIVVDKQKFLELYTDALCRKMRFNCPQPMRCNILYQMPQCR
jgi:hypothetical protein